jgi:hypothetical protein
MHDAIAALFAHAILGSGLWAVGSQSFKDFTSARSVRRAPKFSKTSQFRIQLAKPLQPSLWMPAGIFAESLGSAHEGFSLALIRPRDVPDFHSTFDVAVGFPLTKLALFSFRGNRGC